MRRFLCIIVALTFLLVSCSPNLGTQPVPDFTQQPPELLAPTPTNTPQPLLWISPAAPATLRDEALAAGLAIAETREQGTIILEPSALPAENTSEWVYALVAPFPTVEDGLTFGEVEQAWKSGMLPQAFADSPLRMSQTTYEAMKFLYGQDAAPGAVTVTPESEMLSSLWAERPSWGIVPFEELNPKLKVLEVDGQSPLRKGFNGEAYPLKLAFSLQGTQFSLTATNRDSEKMATLVMTGVTALVRATAYRMEMNGITYPGRDIQDWLVEADIAHISNEIPFDWNCPYPDPNSGSLRFCSDPRYIELLEFVGTDVVELTGNHFQDKGSEATLQTLEMYNQRGWPYFGGGADLADARKPAILERAGMKFAFLGCNPVGPAFTWAREDGYPGASPCGDFVWLVDEIARLKGEGYFVIVTFQYFETYQATPFAKQIEDFRRVAEAGADIVNGSQAHYPQSMEFLGDSFIHYGLGNLFFDQMWYYNDVNSKKPTYKTRYEFLDRHIFYDGKWIGTELLTAMLEDFARPRPMTIEERREFLDEYFKESGWK